MLNFDRIETLKPSHLSLLNDMFSRPAPCTPNDVVCTDETACAACCSPATQYGTTRICGAKAFFAWGEIRCGINVLDN